MPGTTVSCPPAWVLPVVQTPQRPCTEGGESRILQGQDWSHHLSGSAAGRAMTTSTLHPHARRLVRAIVRWTLILAAAASCGQTQTIQSRIDSLSPCAAPRIDSGRMIYSLDISFRVRPETFWAFYDRKARQLVVAMYDISLEQDTFTLPSRLPFADPRLTNYDSNKSLTRHQASLSLSLDPGWYYRCEAVGTSTIHLEFWREIKRQEVRKKRSPKGLLYAGAGVCAVGAALVVIVAVTR